MQPGICPPSIDGPPGDADKGERRHSERQQPRAAIEGQGHRQALSSALDNRVRYLEGERAGKVREHIHKQGRDERGQGAGQRTGAQAPPERQQGATLLGRSVSQQSRLERHPRAHDPHQGADEQYKREHHAE
jgi:hypothetical protein